jgi:hypothetical protein
MGELWLVFWRKFAHICSTVHEVHLKQRLSVINHSTFSRVCHAHCSCVFILFHIFAGNPFVRPNWHITLLTPPDMCCLSAFNLTISWANRTFYAFPLLRCVLQPNPRSKTPQGWSLASNTARFRYISMHLIYTESVNQPPETIWERESPERPNWTCCLTIVLCDIYLHFITHILIRRQRRRSIWWPILVENQNQK